MLVSEVSGAGRGFVCVFVWPVCEDPSARAKLSIVFGSELLCPTPSGGLRTTLDLLLRSDSDPPIAAIDIVYPHAFPLVIDETGGVQLEGRFWDATRDILSLDSEGNEVYASPPGLDADAEELKIVIPHHTEAEREIKLAGRFVVGNEVNPWLFAPETGFTVDHHQILTDLGFSLWRCALRTPLGKGEQQQRWLRWRMEAPPGAHNRRTRLQRFDDAVIREESRFQHYVFGPYNVIDILLERLAAHKRTVTRELAESSESERPWVEQFVVAANELVGRVRTATAEVRWDRTRNPNAPGALDLDVEDYRIHLPHDAYFGGPRIGRVEGDVATAGGSPTVHPHPGTRPPYRRSTARVLSDYKSGYRALGGRDNVLNGGRFVVPYVVTHRYYWAPVLKWGIAVALAVLALCRS